MKAKSILISQPKPESEKSPYFDLAEKCKVKIDFRSFIHVEGLPEKEFRLARVRIADYTAVIFTSRNAVEHYFRLAEESRFSVPEDMKYFCVSEAIAYYLQKFVIYRKRKIFHGKQKFADLIPTIKKHKEENFLLPCSDIHKQDIAKQLEAAGINFTKAVMYRTVCSDLSDLRDVNYDILVFFSPSGINSLFINFPDFKQNDTKIAVFGASTKKAAKELGLKVNIFAPNPQAPSMTMALEQFIKKTEKKAKVKAKAKS